MLFPSQVHSYGSPRPGTPGDQRRMSGGAMMNDESAQGNVAARKSFFERRRCGNEDSPSAGNLEMVELGLPPPLPPTPPPRPTENLCPIVKTNKDYLTGPMF